MNSWNMDCRMSVFFTKLPAAGKLGRGKTSLLVSVRISTHTIPKFGITEASPSWRIFPALYILVLEISSPVFQKTCWLFSPLSKTISTIYDHGLFQISMDFSLLLFSLLNFIIHFCSLVHHKLPFICPDQNPDH